MEDYTDEELKGLIEDLISMYHDPEELVRAIMVDIIDKKSVLYILSNYGLI